MRRYFFDIDDGNHRTVDSEGLELSDAQAARNAAIDVLPDIARDLMPDGDSRVLVTTVKDENGRPIFRATLSLATEWLV